VFTTSLGNIPAGETVRVEIEYIMELKHDAEVDGLRFTIPTGIAPRYGVAPSYYMLGADTVSDAGGMKISVQVSMSSNIASVQVCKRCQHSLYNSTIVHSHPPTQYPSTSADTHPIRNPMTQTSIHSTRSLSCTKHPTS
jgi:hypothetical protein